MLKKLRVAFTAALGGDRTPGGAWWKYGGLEGTPVVEDGMMYVTDGWGTVYKIDVTKWKKFGEWSQIQIMTSR